MTDKELKKLKRAELLQLLLTQSREIDRLRAELEEVNQKLNERNLSLDNCGSIAEAAMSIHNIFEEAQNAADLYLDNVKRKAEEILAAAARNEKPGANDKIINGMVKGRLNKELKEICLMDQVYVKAEDGKQSVSKYIAEVAKAEGAKIAVKGFVRMETGEGIEKKQEDFAAEVAAQMNK